MDRNQLLGRAALIGALALLVSLAPASALDHHEDAAHAEHADMAMDMPMDMEVSAEVGAILENLKQTAEKLHALAEATPADKFSWAPTDEVRTISEVYMHAAGVNLMLPSALGAALPEGLEMTAPPFEMMGQWEKTVTAKEDVIAKLDESLDYVVGALASVTDLETEVTIFGPPAPKRAYFLILLTHAHEHLGQSIAYARSVGVVPPWSQPAPDAEDDAMAEGAAEGH